MRRCDLIKLGGIFKGDDIEALSEAKITVIYQRKKRGIV